MDEQCPWRENEYVAGDLFERLWMFDDFVTEVAEEGGVELVNLRILAANKADFLSDMVFWERNSAWRACLSTGKVLQ